MASNDPMAGNDQRDRVMADGAAHCLCRHMAACLHSNFGGDVTVGHRMPIGNGKQNIPNLLAKRSAFYGQRRGKIGFFAAEIHIEPVYCLTENRQIFFNMLRGKGTSKVFLAVEPQSGDGRSIACQRDASQRRIIVKRIGRHCYTSKYALESACAYP